MQQILKSPDRGLTLTRGRFVSVKIPGVHVLPRILTDVQIQEIIGLKEFRCHHDDGSHGHDDVGHGGSSEEPQEEEEKKEEPKKEKDKDTDRNKVQKSSPHYFRADKPHRLLWVAELIYMHVPDISIGDMRPCSVDGNMQIYRLQEGAGIVPPHVDEDFEEPDGSLALCSILVYLNSGYSGGETVFNGTTPAPHVAVGGGLVFGHDILHEGLIVLSGEKYVLKTDLLFRRQ